MITGAACNAERSFGLGELAELILVFCRWQAWAADLTQAARRNQRVSRSQVGTMAFACIKGRLWNHM